MTSNVYLILFYNSEIWHLHSLKNNLKQKLLSYSAAAIKSCIKLSTNDISFVDLHNSSNRATPDKFLFYKYALTLYKLMRGTDYTIEWVALNYNQILTSRQTKFKAAGGRKKKKKKKKSSKLQGPIIRKLGLMRFLIEFSHSMTKFPFHGSQ